MNYPDKGLFERFIIGRIRIEAKGNLLYKFINKLKDEKIYCKEQHMKGDTFYFTARRSKKKAIILISKEFGIELTLKEEPSLTGWILKYKNRLGIPIGIILGVGLLIYCSNIVMIIDIEGNEILSDREILTVLEECSVKRGKFIGDIDFYKSEIYVKSCFDEIAWIGMRHTGNRLVVEIMETAERPEMMHNRIPCHIVADKTAQITKTSVTSGQLIKKEGETVKEGDVIVNGIRADEYGKVTFYHSMASITGVYEEEATFFCPSVQTERNFSGNVTEEKVLDIFSFKIPLTFDKNPYEDYNVKIQESPMTLFGKKLPISIDKKLFMEYKSREVLLDDDQMKENLQEQVKLYEENFLSECKIIKRKCKITKKETATVMTVSYIIEGEIGKEKELFIKDNRKPYVVGSKKDD